MTTLGIDALAAPLGTKERRAVEMYISRLLVWQRTPATARWPKWPRTAPELPLATAFVSLARGPELRGSMGSADGATTVERLVRAFLAALHDSRSRPLAAGERDELSIAASFVHSVRDVTRDELALRFEAGADGLAAREPGRPPVLLLPEYASFGQMNIERSWRGLTEKNGAEFSAAAKVYIFRSARVVARPYAKPFAQDPIDAAAAWLAGMVQPDGRFVFEVDPRTGQATDEGPMLHARSATALLALRTHGGFPRETKRATRSLVAAMRAGLADGTIADWPADPAQRAGTLALGVLAGLPLREELLRFAALPAVIASSWHAPQVAAALGPECPPPLWQACASRLATRPWSPWTAFAATRIGDPATYARAASALIASVRPVSAAHAGGVALPRPDVDPPLAPPETALTALVAEALAPAAASSAAARNAIRRATSFVQKRQFSDATTPILIDPRTAEGAFAATPVDPRLRIDVVGHALLALMASRAVPADREDRGHGARSW